MTVLPLRVLWLAVVLTPRIFDAMVFVGTYIATNHCAGDAADHCANRFVITAIANGGTDGGSSNATDDRSTTTMSIPLRAGRGGKEANEQSN
jgi:hypothetical protein